MQVQQASPVNYALPLDDALLPLNEHLGGTLSIEFSGNIHCINCGRKTKKSYSQGYCYPCSQRLAACDMCIVRPHTCHFDAGTCREPDWALAHCYQDHYVYLSLTSGIKVGITRQDQLPTRWIDQGATSALPILKTRSRHIAGTLEHALSRQVSDRTDWRRMLKGDAQPVDLCARASDLLAGAADELAAVREQFSGRTESEPFELLDEPGTEIRYPVRQWPDTVRAHNLDKTPRVSGRFDGIKGQYLMFADGVLNVRKYTGYELTVQTD